MARFSHDSSRSSRVGAHRAVERPGSPGAWVLLSTLVTLILTMLGVLIYTLQPSSISFMDQLGATPSASPSQRVEAVVSPDTSVVVLNGTDAEGLAFAVDEAINENGWGSTLYAGNAEERDVQISAIFYSDEAEEGLARGLGEKLGGISYYLNSSYSTHGNQLTVLLGADYGGPGLDAASADVAVSE